MYLRLFLALSVCGRPGTDNFVVGSDEYKGRGGTGLVPHAKDYNTNSFSTGIIWDFLATLLDPNTLALVQDELLPCAIHSDCIHLDLTLLRDLWNVAVDPLGVLSFYTILLQDLFDYLI
ncbi:hypothetical protein HGM15179_018390 [Zosterops borbonicus]|uniref:Uncharacterized protein n=1 Tax=Zosterops borbonicus TaxID=364589 RepID=A0A8K1FZ38_9PASS|nr:hypothetical protein HGM15179_018390 [Zosterops borbonicus]